MGPWSHRYNHLRLLESSPRASHSVSNIEKPKRIQGSFIFSLRMFDSLSLASSLFDSGFTTQVPPSLCLFLFYDSLIIPPWGYPRWRVSRSTFTARCPLAAAHGLAMRSISLPQEARGRGIIQDLATMMPAHRRSLISDAKTMLIQHCEDWSMLWK